jgi:hypothetical protein
MWTFPPCFLITFLYLISHILIVPHALQISINLAIWLLTIFGDEYRLLRLHFVVSEIVDTRIFMWIGYAHHWCAWCYMVIPYKHTCFSDSRDLERAIKD